MELLVWGAGGHAAVIADIAVLSGKTVVGFIDDSQNERVGSTWCNKPVFDLPTAESLIRNGVRHAAVAIGNPRIRLAKAEILNSWGSQLATLVHPRAIVAESAILGEGTVVCAGAVVQPLARLGTLCIVNTLASVDHECELAGAVHLCPGVHLGGHVKAGMGAWVGIGTTVRDRIHLGEWCLIGAGSTVVNDIAANVLSFGVPATLRGRSPYENA